MVRGTVGREAGDLCLLGGQVVARLDGSFARVLNLPEPAALLEQTLTEESAAEQRLTQIAETSVNRDAVAVHNTPHMLTLL